MLRRLTSIPILALALLAILLVIAGLGPVNQHMFTAKGLPDIMAACQTDDPYLVSACYRGILRSEASRPFEPRAPSILLFNETDSDYPHYELANFEEVGTVWGLAYSQKEFAVYAGAMHKRQLPFGPAGPGGIYRLSLNDGTITTFATVPNAGDEMHEANLNGPDLKAKKWAGKTSLGDIDLNDDETELYVMNLYDKQIYRYDVETAQLIGTIPFGAANEPWVADARPFGLELKGDKLYHGVINSAQDAGNPANLWASVYRSELDGSDMKEVARVDLNYRRGSIHIGNSNSTAKVDWKIWDDTYTNDLQRGFFFVVYPMPMLTDIEIDENNNMVLGLRDRIMDTGAQLLHFANSLRDENLTFGPGDVLNGSYDDATDSWVFDTSREHYQDNTPFIGDESGQGGLAHIWYLNKLVAGGIGIQLKRIFENPREGYLWYDEPTGAQELREETCAAEVSQRPFGNAELVLAKPALAHNGEIPPKPIPTPGTATPEPYDARGPGSVGDVELLCKPLPPPPNTAVPEIPTEPPTVVPPTDTPVPPTNTPVPPTNTPVPPPPTPTPTPGPIYLPIIIKEECVPGYQHTDVVMVIDASSSMLELTGAGRSKLDAAKAGAKSFIDMMSQGDQVSIVSFNTKATMHQMLTMDRAAAKTAVDAIKVAQFTRIDLGLQAAHDEMNSGRHVTANTPTIILVTDGRNNPEPVSSAIAQSDAIKAGNIRLFTIGIGQDIDALSLQQMASSPSDYYFTPDAEKLLEIYKQLAGTVPCAPESFFPYPQAAGQRSGIETR